MPKEKLQRIAVILAGGRGTRFWPRSRTRTPKQLLNIVGSETMLEQTAARLAPLFLARAQSGWSPMASKPPPFASNCRAFRASNILAEPVGRNTAAAIGLAAIHLRHRDGGDALMAVLPADHFIAQPARYRAHRASRACTGRARPARWSFWASRRRARKPDTATSSAQQAAGALRRRIPLYAVRRFTEKPALAARPEIRRLRPLFLERGNVFLARLHISRKSAAASCRRRTPR